MEHARQFYVDGAWVEPATAATITVIDPSTEQPFATVASGTAADIDRAVTAARKAFPGFAATSRAERIALLRRILDVYETRGDDLAQALSREMGAPITLAAEAHLAGPVRQFSTMMRVLEDFPFEERRGTSRIFREPVGVCGLITPWNWPLVQIACKLAPALAAGCTMVLKPSEITPLSAIIVAEIMHAAGVPKGVFNLVNGTGPIAGEAIAVHQDVDMVSFTGSTRAGIRVAKLAADTVKRVHQELGGKSPNLLLPDVDLDAAVTAGVAKCFRNSGQACNAPSRMLVPASMHDRAAEIAKRAAEALRSGPASEAATTLGPVSNAVQFGRVQHFIEAGIRDGARLVTGGLGRPEALPSGYHVRPTVFAGVTPEMTIAQEEIFGPVIALMPYKDIEHAISIANHSMYGLAAYVQSPDLAAARKVATRLRAGSVMLNYPGLDASVPFGGYKQSGNGREYAEFGLAEFLELKAVLGYEAA